MAEEKKDETQAEKPPVLMKAWVMRPGKASITHTFRDITNAPYYIRRMFLENKDVCIMVWDERPEARDRLAGMWIQVSKKMREGK